jgi:tetratricopeptide (TPR) repeat protein
MVSAVRHTFIIGLLASLTLVSQVRADDWPVTRGPSHEPEPYRYDPIRLNRAPHAFLEDTAACIIYSGTTYLLEPDGTVETITHEITRLNGRKGVESLGEYSSITWDPAYQKLVLNEARVLKPGGRVVPIEPRHVQLRDVNADYAVYGSEKQLVISFPNLEVGDVYEVKWTTRGKNPEFGQQFFTRYNFGDDRYPVLQDELRVRLPRDRNLKFATVNGKIEPVVREEGKDRLYLWHVRNRPELPQDSELPSKEEFRLQVMCSTFASWEEVGKWKRELRAECWECCPAIRDTVREVTCGLKTPEEKTRALARWVRRRIRYVSFSSARNGYTPHHPRQVHENLFGDCKDQAQLLAVMLREAGIEPTLVTLGMRDDGQVVPEVPCPWGTHAIVLVTINGRDHWIDTTATGAPWDFLPRVDRNRVAYVTDGKGIRVLRTPGLAPADNRFEQATEVWVQPDGTAHCRRTLRFDGLAALQQREAWTDVPQGERRRLMAAELQDANSRTRLRWLRVDERSLRELDEPVCGTLEFDIPEQFTGDPDREGSFSDSRVWGRLLGYNLDYDRKVPLDLWAPFESVHRYIIHLPPGYRFGTLPADKTISSRVGSFQLQVRADTADAHRLELVFQTRLVKGRVDAADFAAYRQFHRQVSQAWRAWVAFTPSHDLAEAPALEALLAWQPGDLISASVLARLYQAQGKLAEAQRVVRQALVFHPQDASLWELAVASAGSLEQEEAVYREAARRFPEEWKYTLAQGRICVALGRHRASQAVLEPLTRLGSPAAKAKAHYYLARSAIGQKQPAVALRHLEAARRADAASLAGLDAYRLQGTACAQLGQTEEAIRAYRQALLENPASREILPLLVRLEIKAGQSGEAMDHLRRFTLAVAGDLQGLVDAASLHLELGRYDDALDLALRAREIGFHADAQLVLGLVYLHRGDLEKAVFHLERGRKDPAAFLGLIRAHLAQGNLGRALWHARGAASLPAQPPDLRRACALVERLNERKTVLLKEPASKTAGEAAVDALVCAEHAYDSGQKERALALVRRILADGSEYGPAFGLRGLLMLEGGQLSRALGDAERAIGLSPRDARGYYVRGRVRLERAQGGDGLADLLRAAQITGRGDAQILHWLAMSLAQGGRHAEALATQREAIRLRPQDHELRDQLRRLERLASQGSGTSSGGE